jgi:predicted ABC-type ATPase
VYLYFVTTADPDINVARVRSRVAQGGHDVPEDRIRDRYTKSLELMYNAAQEAYQAYFFDNSGTPNNHQQIAHFKVVGKKKKWDDYNPDDLPDWFIQYYVNKS